MRPHIDRFDSEPHRRERSFRGEIFLRLRRIRDDGKGWGVIGKWFLYALAFLIPIGTKKYLFSFVPFVSDYNSVFLFGLDALILFFLAAWGFRIIRWNLFAKFLAVFSVAGLLPIFWSPDKGLVFYAWAHLSLLMCFALAVAGFFREKKAALRGVLWALGSSAMIQSLVSFAQFGQQKSIGLHLLGESVIDATTKGVARVTVDGLSFLRAYGTMPHANILAAFLVMGLVALVGLFLLSRHGRILSATLLIGLFAVLGALLFTFSRSGWIVAVVSTATLLAYALFKKSLRRRALVILVACVVALALFFAQFGWLVFPRAHFTAQEDSVTHRVGYDVIGLNLFLENPFGVGWGDQILAAERAGLYKEEGLGLSWQEQPIHNIYMLIATEAGVQGVVASLVALFFSVKFAFTRLKKMEPGERDEFLVAFVLLFGPLLFGLVDHFTWDLEAGQAMLWLSLGIVMGMVEYPVAILARE